MKLEASGISFRYQKGNREILNNVSLEAALERLPFVRFWQDIRDRIREVCFWTAGRWKPFRATVQCR